MYNCCKNYIDVHDLDGAKTQKLQTIMSPLCLLDCDTVWDLFREQVYIWHLQSFISLFNLNCYLVK